MIAILTPDYLLHISEPAEEIAEQLHQDILNRIIERIMLRLGRGEDYILSAVDKWQIEVLEDAGYLLEDIQREIAKRTKLQQTEIAEAMEDAGVRALQYDDVIYKAAGLSPVPLTQSPYLMRLMQRNYEATMGEWKNFTRTTAESAQRAFIDACDKAYHLASSGAVSYTQAVREAVNEMASSGVVVRYPTGHTDTIETATLRAVRTGISQATGAIQMARMEEMDWDIVLTSAHLGARTGDGGQNPGNHLWWQGQFFSRTGKTPHLPLFVESTGYGTGEGLCGWNCRHSFGPGDGVNNPFNIKNITFADNYKAEELQKKQRALERRIRKTKREVMTLKAAIDNAKDPALKLTLEQDYQRKSALLEKQNKAYNDFCKENSLKRLPDRLAIAKWDRKQAAAASGAARRWENGKVSAEIEKQKKAAEQAAKTQRQETENQKLLKTKIQDESITKTLNHEKQAPHMFETRKPGKSYFKEGVTEEQLQQIINERSGTGIIRVTNKGQIRETIDYDEEIGVNVNVKNGSEEDTNRFTIHYSKTRTHVVPTRKIKKEKMN